MNKVITWCKKNNYHILNGSLNEDNEIVVSKMYTTIDRSDPWMDIAATEKLLVVWCSDDSFVAYVGCVNGKWIAFIEKPGLTINKVQGSTLKILQNKILNNDSSSIPRE